MNLRPDMSVRRVAADFPESRGVFQRNGEEADRPVFGHLEPLHRFARRREAAGVSVGSQRKDLGSSRGDDGAGPAFSARDFDRIARHFNVPPGDATSAPALAAQVRLREDIESVRQRAGDADFLHRRRMIRRNVFSARGGHE